MSDDRIMTSRLPAIPGRVHASAIPNALAPHKRWTGTVPDLVTLSHVASTICDMAHVPHCLRGQCKIWLNGISIPAWAHDKIRVQHGDRIELIVCPRGSGFNSFLKLVGAVVGIAIAAWAPFTGFAGAAFVNGLFAAGATLGISLLADAIAPIRPPKYDTKESLSASPTYSLNASSNSMGFGQPIRRLFGRHLVPPTRIMDDYTEISGSDEYLYFLGVIGIGAYQLEDPQIGDTDLDLYKDVFVQYCYGHQGEAIPNIFPSVVYQESLSIQLLSTDSLGNQLDSGNWWVTRSTRAGVDEIGMDIQAPQGLYELDDKANRKAISRSVQIRYRTKGGVGVPVGEWHGLTSKVTAQSVSLPSAVWPAYTETVGDRDAYPYTVHHPAEPYSAPSLVYIDQSGVIGVANWKVKKHEIFGTVSVSRREFDNPALPSSFVTLIARVTITGDSISSFTPEPILNGTGISITQSGPLTLSFSAGTFSTAYTFVTLTGHSAEPDKAVRKGIKWRVPYSSTGYDIQIRRNEQESTNSRVVDALYWSAIRAADTTQKPYAGDIPIAMMGMKIRASNQLSGSLPLVTLIATSELSDWDRKAKNWNTVRPTRNPASAFLDVLRGTANLRPRKDEEIDFDSIQRWHEWCDDNGYLFDGVYDTQSKVWDALSDIAAAGRGSPCLIDGKFGIVWQHEQPGQPVGHITVRNSRDFKSSREYKELIHGVKIKFVSEDLRYEQDELTVYAPGYDEHTATLFESLELFGTTTPDLAAMRGRWYLMQALLLIEQYSVTMPLEFLRLKKGDKIRVLRPEVLYGIGSAALVAWTLDDAGNITAIRWDAELQMTPGQRYAAIVRLGDGSEWTVTGTSDDGRTMRIDDPLPAPVPAPRKADLVMVGTVDDVGRMCLVTSIKPGSNLTAIVGLCDYVEELYQKDGQIPDYTPSITLPGTGPLRKAKTPIITSIRSDESVLTYSSGRGSQPRIYLEWQFSDDSTTVQVRYRQTGTDVWSYVPALQSRATECYISGVKEGWDIVEGVKIQNGITYDVQVRAVNQIGWASDWASISGHAVVGRTTPPLPPDAVGLDGYVLTIMMENKPIDVVGFEVFIAMDDTDTFGMSLKVTSPYTADGKFDLKPWAGHARRYYVRAIDEVGLTSDLISGLIDFGDVRPDNILVEYSQKDQNWPGTLVNGTIGEKDRLYASDETFVFASTTEDFVFADTAKSLVFPTSSGAPLVYTFSLSIPRDMVGARVLIVPDIVQGTVQSIEWRKYTIPYLFSSGDAYIFPAQDMDFVFPTIVPAEWEATPTNYISPGNEVLDVRVTFAPGESSAIVDDIRVILDVPDVVFPVNNIRVPASGLRLPIPQKTFRTILGVTFGVEAVSGLTAEKPVTLDKNGSRDESGYLLEGPLVVGIDASGNYAEIQIDAVISGY